MIKGRVTVRMKGRSDRLQTIKTGSSSTTIGLTVSCISPALGLLNTCLLVVEVIADAGRQR